MSTGQDILNSEDDVYYRKKGTIFDFQIFRVCVSENYFSRYSFFKKLLKRKLMHFKKNTP